MARRTLLCHQDPLGNQLRREALESRPAFSEALHDRILGAIGTYHEEDADCYFDETAAGSCSSMLPNRKPRQRLAVQNASSSLLGRIATVIAVACVVLVLVGVGLQWPGRSMAVLTPPNFATNATHHTAENQNTNAATADSSPFTSPSTTKHPTSLRKPSDWRRLASISPSQTAWPNRNTTDTDPNANRLVYEDARRAARVLLDRLPVDLPLADFALVDQ